MNVVTRWIADGEPSTRFPVYTRANVGEVFPDPVTPLSASLLLFPGSEMGWRDAWAEIGAFAPEEYDPDHHQIVGVFGGYCYLNASMLRVFGERTPGLSAQAMDDQFYGAQPGIPPYEPAPGDHDPARTEAITATLAWVLTAESLPELLEDQAVTRRLREDRPDLSALSDAALVARTRTVAGDHYRRLFARHLRVTVCATIPAGVIDGVCHTLGRPEDALRLLAGVGDVDSAAPSLAMWDLGRMVAGSAPLRVQFDRGVPGLLERLRSAASDGSGPAIEFLRAFERFIHEFGSRGPNEWEMSAPNWEARPELPLAAIDRMRLAPDSMAPAGQNAARAAERERVGAEMVAALAGDPDTQAQFTAALRAAVVFQAGRERTKTNIIRVVNELRMAMRELGARMVARGVFAQVDDFAMLFDAEYDDFLAHPDAYVACIRERRAAYDELAALEPQFVFAGKPDFPAAWRPRAEAVAEVAKASAGDVLAGFAGCPGVATGRARVILDAADPTALEPGDVLVAPSTDPAWTPLFVPAAAVVVDVGAMQSHAVIVSRELGIPCVVSVTGATRTIPDGAIVRVDGTAGTVEVLSVA